jgi:hypothetical protein
VTRRARRRPGSRVRIRVEEHPPCPKHDKGAHVWVPFIDKQGPLPGFRRGVECRWCGYRLTTEQR